MESSKFRYASYNRFNEYWKFYFPYLRCTRLASDACGPCVRISITLKDPNISKDEKKELETQKSMHIAVAKAQRKFMSSAVSASISSWVLEEGDLKDVLFVLGNLDDTDSRDIEHDSKLRNVIVQCEDLGQSIAMPHYGYEQPGLDYFNSNLMMHEFVVADRVSNRNTVYFYDERVLKKDGESMCILRLYDHLFKLEKYLTSRTPSPKSYIAVMDNCCGQNKSKTVMMFFQLLSILFYENIALNYLLPGHSHMAADRAVSWVRTSLGKNNI